MSYFLVALVAGTHLGALPVVVWSLPVTAGWSAALVLAVLLSAGIALPVATLRGRHSVVRLRQAVGGGWELRERSMAEWQAAELVDCRRHARWLVLGFRTPARGVRHVPILWDALGAEEFRRLRVAVAAGSRSAAAPGRG